MEDTQNTSSADDQIDIGKGLSDQMGCAVFILFFGLSSAIVSGAVVFSLVV